MILLIVIMLLAIGYGIIDGVQDRTERNTIEWHTIKIVRHSVCILCGFVAGIWASEYGRLFKYDSIGLMFVGIVVSYWIPFLLTLKFYRR